MRDGFLALQSDAIAKTIFKQLPKVLWRQSILDFIAGSLIVGIEQPVLVRGQMVVQVLADHATQLVDAQIMQVGNIGLLGS